MKKLISSLLILALLTLSLAGCSGKDSQSGTGSSPASGVESGEPSTSSGTAAPEGGELVLYTWEGMFPQEVLDGFTQETGIQVNYANFDYDETMLARLEAAKGGDYDVVIADDYIIETVIQEGLAQKLDLTKLENYKSINPVYQGQFFDPGDEYTVPYGAGVQTIVYNPEVVSKEIAGYEDLWDESLKDNVGIIANYRVIDGMALKVLGQSYNTEDSAVIEEAGEKLQELAPNIRLIKDDNIQDDLISGEVGAAVMYTSQVTVAMMASKSGSAPEFKVVYPKEGIGFGIMGMFIPSEAPNAEAAHQFIDYILRPEISAKCYEYIGFYCTNKDADSLISEDYQEFLTLPEDFSQDDMEMIGNISAEALEVHQKVWTEFKATCE